MDAKYALNVLVIDIAYKARDYLFLNTSAKSY